MSILNKFTQKKAVHLWPITVLRVYTGVFFAYYGFGKIKRGGFAGSLKGFVSGKLEDSFGIISPFLKSVVLPNKEIFAIMVSWGGVIDRPGPHCWVGDSLRIDRRRRHACSVLVHEGAGFLRLAKP